MRERQKHKLHTLHMESITGSAYTMEITKYALCPEMFTHFSSGEKINCPSLLHSHTDTQEHTNISQRPQNHHVNS